MTPAGANDAILVTVNDVNYLGVLQPRQRLAQVQQVGAGGARNPDQQRTVAQRLPFTEVFNSKVMSRIDRALDTIIRPGLRADECARERNQSQHAQVPQQPSHPSPDFHSDAPSPQASP
jgi:hypothetical protein